MSQQITLDTTAPSDAELIAQVRGGDVHAYGELFDRHRGAALRLARQIGGLSDADDLVSDAFAKVLNVLLVGGGPDVAFRAYLLTSVRRLHIDKIRDGKRVQPTGEIERFDPGVPFQDTAVQQFEGSAAARAFASLPERWQLVLWHLEVEREKPADIAPLLGLTANSVSALAYRAREGLRQAYLQMHMADTAGEKCRWTTERLGAHVRRGLSRRDTAKVDEHLDECARCSAVYLELLEVNSNLRGIIAPLLLGTAAAGYLATTTGGVAAGGLFGFVVKAIDAAKNNAAVTAGTAVVAVAAVTGLTLATQNPSAKQDRIASDPLTSPATSAPQPTSPPPTTKAPPPGTKPPTTAPQATSAPPTTTHPPTVAVPPPPPATLAPPRTAPPTTAPSPETTDPVIVVPPPPTPGPSTVDVSLQPWSVDSTSHRYAVNASLQAVTAAPAKRLTVVLTVSDWQRLKILGTGWRCDPRVKRDLVYECTTDSASPSAIMVYLRYQPHDIPTLSATVTAATYADPEPTNNTRSWVLP